MPIFFSSVLAASTEVLLGQTVLAQDGGGGSILDMLPMLAIVFMIFYFLVIRPASKEKKERESKLKGLKKHDKVVTNAGIHGTVMSLDDDTMVLRVDDKNNVRMKFSRAALWQVLTPGGEADGKSSGPGPDQEPTSA